MKQRYQNSPSIRWCLCDSVSKSPCKHRLSFSRKRESRNAFDQILDSRFRGNDQKKVPRAREGHFLLKAGSKMIRETLKCIPLSWVGYILSPLSFWNDAFVNIPIASCDWPTFSGPFSRKSFLPGMIFGYWLSNILGIRPCSTNIRKSYMYGKTRRAITGIYQRAIDHGSNCSGSPTP